MESSKELTKLGNLLPEALYNKLKILAQNNSRSVDVEIVHLLTMAVGLAPSSSAVDDIDAKTATMNAA